MREAKIEDHFAKEWAAMGGEFRKVKWIGRRNAPDKLFGHEELAVSFWVEFKAPGEVPRIGQVREIARMRSWGMTVYLIDSMEMANAILERYRG